MNKTTLKTKVVNFVATEHDGWCEGTVPTDTLKAFIKNHSKAKPASIARYLRRGSWLRRPQWSELRYLFTDDGNLWGGTACDIQSEPEFPEYC